MATWYCCRQRAGPLVKECRALRPRFSSEDTAADHSAKAQLKKYSRCAVNRRQVDRLELYLALMGWQSSMHTLTFDNEHLPRDFKGVRAALQSFFRRSQRWRAGLGKTPAFDYIYCIEGLHGSRRYHVHLITDDNQLSPAEVAFLWRCGNVDNEPVLLGKDGFQRIAEYLNKERTDGFVIPIGRHPWSCSRSLTLRMPPPERWHDVSGVIEVPQDAVWVRRNSVVNDFGAFYFSSWIERPARATDLNRACARALNLEI